MKRLITVQTWYTCWLVLLVHCSGSDTSNYLANNEPSSFGGVACGNALDATPNYTAFSGNTNTNILPVVVGNSTLCGSNVNIPCTTVAVCQPGTTNCQTIGDILVDTGSTGLRIFAQALPVSICSQLKAVVDASNNPIGECAQFATSNDWGAVLVADVILAGEDPVTVPIQVIDAQFANIPDSCNNPEQSPTDAQLNGILGVGLDLQDCGNVCTSNSNNFQYFACSATGCFASTVLISQQVQNPVALLPTDNNGVVIQFPSVDPNFGAVSLTGELILGIGTQTNNTPAANSGIVTYPVGGDGFFTTVFDNITYDISFLDTGSDVLFIPDTSLAGKCPDTVDYTNDSSFLCPLSGVYQTYTATTKGYNNTPVGSVNFDIGNPFTLQINDPNSAVFNDIAIDSSSLALGTKPIFDWGLPFFMGRSVYVGYTGKTSSMGTGPYWSY